MRLFLLMLIMSVLSCNQEKKEPVVGILEQTQTPFELKVYDYNGIEKFLYQNDDKVHVVNFWATWCVPCVKELPHFEELQNQYEGEGVEVLLISLDFPKDYETKLKPFVEDRKLRSKVIALDDVDMNAWLPKVNEDWSGAIPVTIIYKNEKRQFYEQSFTYEQLETEVKQFIQ